MSKKQVILHIGAPKTATTLIQSCLKKSSSRISESGIHICDFLGSVNHKVLAYTFLDNGNRDKIQKNLKLDSAETRSISKIQIKNKLLELIDSNSIDKFIISSEDLQSKLDQKGIKELSEFFKELNVTVSIILYIREQASAINSHFSTVLKSGTFGIRLKPKRLSSNIYTNSRYNYLKAAKQWYKYFPDNFKLLIFDKKDFYGGTIISDFCFHAQIPYDILLDAYEDVNNSSFQRNTSLTDKHVKLLNLFNFYRQSKNYTKAEAIKIINQIKGLQLPSKSYIMPRTLWHEIREIFLDTNEELRQCFFPNRKTLFDYSSEKLN